MFNVASAKWLTFGERVFSPSDVPNASSGT
jgi:hypothetical protein